MLLGSISAFPAKHLVGLGSTVAGTLRLQDEELWV